MSGKLVIGLPSKGRLQENANAFFASAGLKVRQEGGRGYTGRLDGIANVEIAFLSASEIAGQLEQGLIHLGVTGEDLIREKLSTPERDVELLRPPDLGTERRRNCFVVKVYHRQFGRWSAREVDYCHRAGRAPVTNGPNYGPSGSR